jgi:ribosomal protein L35
MNKPRKSISKRIRVTKTGKVMLRKRAQNHFKAKKTGNAVSSKRKQKQLGPQQMTRILSQIS